MPSKSPYASSFKSALKRGTPAGVAVNAIAKRLSKSPTIIFNSLHKAELCDRQKINGHFIYWPAENIKRSATQAKAVQQQLWQSLTDWAIASGQCKPEQLSDHKGSQNDFMSYCRRHFNKQITGGSASASASSRKRSTSRKSSYKFPTSRSSSTRRYRKAA